MIWMLQYWSSKLLREKVIKPVILPLALEYQNLLINFSATDDLKSLNYSKYIFK